MKKPTRQLEQANVGADMLVEKIPIQEIFRYGLNMDRRVVPYQVKGRAFGDEDFSMHQDLPMKGANISRPSRPPQMPVKIIDFFDPQFFLKIAIYGTFFIDYGAPGDKGTKV